MICVISNDLDIEDPPHRTNKPFLRKRVIEDEIKPDCECVTLVCSHINRNFLREAHTEHYISFLEKCYESAKSSKDGWLITNGLVPVNFSKERPDSRIPIHKHSGYYGSDVMSPIYEHTYHNAMISAEQARVAGKLSSPNKIIYALTTSPGHHAKREEYGGYCFFNNAIIASLSMKKTHKLDTVYILDLDYHAGNGATDYSDFIQGIEPFSIHAHPKNDYPSFESYPSERDWCLNGCVDNLVYMKTLCDVLELMDENSKCGLVIAFGGDTWKNDPDVNPNSRFHLELDDYVAIGKLIGTKFSSIPIVVTQEGGYDMNVIGFIVKNFLEGLSFNPHKASIL